MLLTAPTTPLSQRERVSQQPGLQVKEPLAEHLASIAQDETDLLAISDHDGREASVELGFDQGKVVSMKMTRQHLACVVRLATAGAGVPEGAKEMLTQMLDQCCDIPPLGQVSRREQIRTYVHVLHYVRVSIMSISSPGVKASLIRAINWESGAFQTS